MEKKIKKILDSIGLDEEFYEELEHAKLNDFDVDDLKRVVTIDISNNDDLSLNTYNELINKFEDYFDAKIDLSIDNTFGASSHFKEHFDDVVNNYNNLIPRINSFKDKIVFNGNALTIDAVNEIDKGDIEETLERIKELIKVYGSSFSYVINIDEGIKEDIDKSIEKETFDIMSRPYVEAKSKSSSFVPKRRKKEVDEKTICGNLIREDEEIWKIKSVNKELEDIVIEGKVFGIEEFVPASKAFITCKKISLSTSLSNSLSI